jgi:hypothetical protein
MKTGKTITGFRGKPRPSRAYELVDSISLYGTIMKELSKIIRMERTQKLRLWRKMEYNLKTA